MLVTAPFFNDPAKPNSESGQPLFGLWEYEVVELFLLNDNDQYVEIELCPWGQHIVLLLDGRHNAIRHSLPLTFTAEIRSNNTWYGEAVVPADYLPPRVTKMNAFAIHGSGKERIYEALYSVPKDAFPNPDFHRLNFFQPIDIDGLVPNSATLSAIWADSIKKGGK